MAEFLLRSILPLSIRERVVVASAGTRALCDYPAEPLAVEAMHRIGIDIHSHHARQLDREMVGQADLVLTMENRHLQAAQAMEPKNKSKVKLLTDFYPLSREPQIEDPYGGPLIVYQTCIVTMQPCIQGVANWVEDHLTTIKGTH